MFFSASQLVKSSASQILYFKTKKYKPEVTKNQIIGNKHADKIVKQQKAASEKRGIVKTKDFNILFSIDMLKDNLAVEIKNVVGEYEQWYLESSILQSTFYYTMLLQCKTLDTPKFRQIEGYPQEIVNIPDNIDFQLWFGDNKYQIFADYNVFSFYKDKAKVIFNSLNPIDYDNVRTFDKIYKFNEYKHLKPHYEKIIT